MTHTSYVRTSDASGYPLCQKRLVGALPNPPLIAEVPSAAARFANAFSAPAICLVHVQGRTCTKCQKKRVRFKGFTSSEPVFSSLIECSTEHLKRSPVPAFRLCRMFASKIFQSVPKNAILIRLQDKKKSLAKISGLWHNESRTIFDPQEMPPSYHTEGDENGILPYRRPLPVSNQLL